MELPDDHQIWQVIAHEHTNTHNTDEIDAFDKITQTSNSSKRWEGEDRAVLCTHSVVGPFIWEEPVLALASLLPPQGQPVGTWWPLPPCTGDTCTFPCM